MQALAEVAAAQRQHVRTQRQRPARLQIQVLDLHLARAVVELFLLHVAVGHAPAPAASVRQRPLAAAVIGFRGGGAARSRARGPGRQRLDRLAQGVLKLLAHRGRFQHDVVIAIGRERQLGGHAFGVALAKAVVDVVFVALRGLAVDLQAQQVVLDRAGQVKVALVNVARLAAFLDGRIHADFAMPFVRHLARDDVDHAAHGVRAVQRRHGAAHHFNALDGRQRRRPAAFDARRIRIGAGFARVLTLAVDQDQRVLRSHAAQADVLAVAAARDDDARHFHQRVVQVAVELLVQVFARDHADRGGRILDALLEAAGGHDNRVHRRGGVRGLGQDRLRPETETRGAQGGGPLRARCGDALARGQFFPAHDSNFSRPRRAPRPTRGAALASHLLMKTILILELGLAAHGNTLSATFIFFALLDTAACTLRPNCRMHDAQYACF